MYRGGRRAPVLGRERERVEAAQACVSPSLEGKQQHAVPSLFTTALLFIADNVQHVESLLGFPEQVAHSLFRAVLDKRKFSDADAGHKALKLFSHAYGPLVLSSLCLRYRFMLLSEKLEAVMIFRDLRRLDLFGCRLGDNHEILTHLTSDALSRLTHLSLGDNCLTDSGMRKMTAPIRVMKRGLGELQLLDLSYNPITEQAVRYLRSFPKLQALDLSGTDVKLGPSVHQTLQDTVGLVKSETPMKDFCHSRCKTRGWAEQVVDQWEACMSALSTQKKCSQARAAALCFYGKNKLIQQNPIESSTTSPAPEKETIHFLRPAANVESRKRRGEPLDSRALAPPSKRSLPSALSTEDWQLLNFY